jgi:hypothetical protein
MEIDEQRLLIIKTVITEMTSVLKQLEWSKVKSETGWSSNGFCPVCDKPKFASHSSQCPLGNSLRRGLAILKEG